MLSHCKYRVKIHRFLCFLLLFLIFPSRNFFCSFFSWLSLFGEKKIIQKKHTSIHTVDTEWKFFKAKKKKENEGNVTIHNTIIQYEQSESICALVSKKGIFLFFSLSVELKRNEIANSEEEHSRFFIVIQFGLFVVW